MQSGGGGNNVRTCIWDNMRIYVLSFLGFGVLLSAPSWGTMLSDSGRRCMT